MTNVAAFHFRSSEFRPTDDSACVFAVSVWLFRLSVSLRDTLYGQHAGMPLELASGGKGIRPNGPKSATFLGNMHQTTNQPTNQHANCFPFETDAFPSVFYSCEHAHQVLLACFEERFFISSCLIAGNQRPTRMFTRRAFHISCTTTSCLSGTRVGVLS